MLHFNDEDALLAFLISSPEGHCLLREAAYAQPWLVQEMLERHKVSHVLVKAYRDGLVEVYGPRHVRAKIVLLGRSVTFPGHEMEREQEVDETVGENYRRYNWPKYKRAAALRGLWPCTRLGIAMES